MKAAQLRAALLEGSGTKCSSGKRVGEQGCDPIKAQRRGEVTQGGGQSGAPRLYPPKYGCQMAWSRFWTDTGTRQQGCDHDRLCSPQKDRKQERWEEEEERRGTQRDGKTESRV